MVTELRPQRIAYPPGVLSGGLFLPTLFTILQAMQNTKPTPEIKDFARAVLALIEYKGAYEFYIKAEDYGQLCRLARAVESHEDEPDGGVSVFFNGRRIRLHPEGGQEKAPLIEAREWSEAPHWSRTNTRQAALVMLDKLPNEPKLTLSRVERADLMLGLKQIGNAFPAALAELIYQTAPGKEGKILKAWPKLVHKALKRGQ